MARECTPRRRLLPVSASRVSPRFTLDHSEGHTMTTSTTDVTRLASALQALAKGLPNPWDESTDFFREFVAPLPSSTALDVASFRAVLDVGARYEIDLSGADDILTQLGGADSPFGADFAGSFNQLGTVMRATLSDLSLAFARGKGVTRVRVWLFGRTADGTLVGLRSVSTET